MPHGRLILVEGLPGSGKSTTAQQIWLGLEAQGRAARWWFEHEEGHPIFDDDAVRRARAASAGEDEGVFARAQAGWRALAGRLAAADEVVILESAVFQTTVGTQLLRDASPEAIREHFRQTVALIAPLAPELVRLRPADPAAALRRTCARRHPWFEAFLQEQFAASARGRRLGRSDPAAIVEYFIDREAITDALAAEWPGPVITHDNTDGDWTRQRRLIGEFLQVSLASPIPDAARLGDYPGRYVAAGGDVWDIAADQGGLFLADGAGSRLIPHGPDAFVIEGLCVELRFERSREGLVSAIRSCGALPGLAPHWTRASARG